MDDSILSLFLPFGLEFVRVVCSHHGDLASLIPSSFNVTKGAHTKTNYCNPFNCKIKTEFVCIFSGKILYPFQKQVIPKMPVLREALSGVFE